MLAACAIGIDPEAPLSVLEMRDVPEPDPPEGWEVVEVRAASLNHHDLWTLRGVGVDPDGLPQVLGTDMSGVTAGGRAVVVHAVLSTARPGEDETLSPDFHLLSERGIPGTIAERVAVPSRNLVTKPAALTYAEAACLPTAYLTAYRMLFTRAQLRPGSRVLVQGAGGGVSTAALILARAAGITVYVTSRSAEKRARAMELGAALAVAPGERLPERVEAVIETVGRATWGHSLRSLVPGGTIVVSGATTGGDPPAELSRMFWRGLTVMGSSMGTIVELERLCAFMERSDVRPAVDTELPIERAPEAFARLDGGGEYGKVVVTRAGPPAAEEAVAWAEAALTETRAVSAPSSVRA